MMRISGNGKSKVNVAGKWHKTAQTEQGQDQWDQDYNYLLSTYPGLMDRMMQIQQEAGQEETELGPPPPEQMRHAVSTGIAREFPQAMQDPVVLRAIQTLYMPGQDAPEKSMAQPMAQPMPRTAQINPGPEMRASDHQPGMTEPGHNAYRGDARRAAIQTGQQLMQMLENAPENVLDVTWKVFQQKMEQVLEGINDENVNPWGRPEQPPTPMM